MKTINLSVKELSDALRYKTFYSNQFLLVNSLVILSDGRCRYKYKILDRDSLDDYSDNDSQSYYKYKISQIFY